MFNPLKKNLSRQEAYDEEQNNASWNWTFREIKAS